MMVDPSQSLSWGCYTCRPCCNLLSGSLAVPAGDHCAAEFLLFDTKDKAPYLCRYVDGTNATCRVLRLEMRPQAAALSSPRQLLLSSRLRLFASLEVVSGVASVSIWRLPDAEAECHLVDRLERLEGIQTAKAICWANRALPPFAEGELLSVLLSDRVLLIPVLSADGTFLLQPAMVLQIGFPCRCLCWSNDGSQLLVGGKGQLLCFAWKAGTAGDGEPLVRHLLSSGECVEIHAVFSNSFLCRIDQCSQPAEPELMLPGQALGPSSRPLAPLVQVIENPQDGPSEGPNVLSIPGGAYSNSLGSLGSTWQNPVSAEVAGAVGLQVVPCQRYLLPIRCSFTKDRGHPALRLQCGTECEANELVAVAESGGKAVVLHGSFTSSEVCCWNLSPPHQWGRSDWQQVATFSLAQTLRLSGLALWPGASLEVHALLSEAPAPGEFGRPKRELFHRSEVVSESNESPRVEQLLPEEHTETQQGEGRNEALCSIASNVAGIRQEMGNLRETFEGFRNDFSRLVAVIEQLANKNSA